MRWAAAAALLLVTPLSAQITRFSSRVDGVRVDVLVTEGRRSVSGLTASDFELRDNGVVQRIADVSSETLPVNVICVLDASGSVVGAPLIQLQEAARSLFTSLAAGDRAALVTFSHRVQLHTALTDDREKLRDLVESVRPAGATAFLDAVFGGLALRESDAGRTLLLLFTDGHDNASWLSATEVLEALRHSDVVVYPVRSPRLRQTRPVIGGAFAPPSDGEAEDLLDALADASGGRVMEVERGRSLASTFVAVLSEFRTRYVLSYTPTGVADAGWHTVDVKLLRGSGQVKARRGYVTTNAAPKR